MQQVSAARTKVCAWYYWALLLLLNGSLEMGAKGVRTLRIEPGQLREAVLDSEAALDSQGVLCRLWVHCVQVVGALCAGCGCIVCRLWVQVA